MTTFSGEYYCGGEKYFINIECTSSITFKINKINAKPNIYFYRTLPFRLYLKSDETELIICWSELLINWISMENEKFIIQADPHSKTLSNIYNFFKNIIGDGQDINLETTSTPQLQSIKPSPKGTLIQQLLYLIFHHNNNSPTDEAQPLLDDIN
jgi:hypothetical protein